MKHKTEKSFSYFSSSSAELLKAVKWKREKLSLSMITKMMENCGVIRKGHLLMGWKGREKFFFLVAFS